MAAPRQNLSPSPISACMSARPSVNARPSSRSRHRESRGAIAQYALRLPGHGWRADGGDRLAVAYLGADTGQTVPHSNPVQQRVMFSVLWLGAGGAELAMAMACARLGWRGAADRCGQPAGTC